MKKKKTKSVFITIVTIVLGFLYQQYLAPKKTSSQTKTANIKEYKSTRAKNIVLTKHARCRMKCRNIDMEEIEMVLASGKVNRRKSKPSKRPCPVMAREAYSRKAGIQNIRVISADCQDKQTIITVIDLSNNYDCYCE